MWALPFTCRMAAVLDPWNRICQGKKIPGKRPQGEEGELILKQSLYNKKTI